METDVNQDFEDYWNEFKIIEETELLDQYLQELDEQSQSFDEAEHEAEWLVAAGLPHLVENFLQGKEVKDADLSTSLRSLPVHQAEAVRRRVRTLNNTIRKRVVSRPRKPDIRDVFKIPEPTIAKEETFREADETRSFSDRNKKWQSSILSAEPVDDSLFAQSHKGDVASDYNGVRIVSYQSIGTLHLPRPAPYKRKVLINSIPTSEAMTDAQAINERLKPRIDDLTSDFAHWNEISDLSELHEEAFHSSQYQRSSEKLGRTWIEYLGEEDLLKLRPLLLLEVTSLFDSCHVNFHKNKALKRKLKEGGNVFGVSLTTLIEKDRQLRSCEHSNVPLIFQKVLSFLERHSTREEGILRIAGHQQKMEVLCNKIENYFYSKPKEIDQLFQPGVVTPHEVATVLKRLLRDLPIPLLTIEYLSAFYNCHDFVDQEMKHRALNLLVLLLPMEYSSTLRALLKYLVKVSEDEPYNKMSVHNVAMIMAPSLFNSSILPRLVLNNSGASKQQKLATQVDLAAKCCRVMESLLHCGESLWIVPDTLVAQVRKMNEDERYRQLGYKENNKPSGNQKKWFKKNEHRDFIARKIDNEVDFQEGIIRVDAPQFSVWKVPVKLTPDMTASDVVLKVVEEAVKQSDIQEAVTKNHRPNPRALSELAPNGNLSCILSTAYPEITLQTHFLYEICGNIAQRQVEHRAVVLDVYKENPNTRWTLRCHHRNANDINR